MFPCGVDEPLTTMHWPAVVKTSVGPATTQRDGASYSPMMAENCMSWRCDSKAIRRVLFGGICFVAGGVFFLVGPRTNGGVLVWLRSFRLFDPVMAATCFAFGALFIVSAARLRSGTKLLSIDGDCLTAFSNYGKRIVPRADIESIGFRIVKERVVGIVFDLRTGRKIAVVCLIGDRDQTELGRFVLQNS